MTTFSRLQLNFLVLLFEGTTECSLLNVFILVSRTPLWRPQL